MTDGAFGGAFGVVGPIGQGFLGCSPHKLWNGNYYAKTLDVQQAHTGGDLEVVISGTPTKEDTQGPLVLSGVEIWTR